MQHHTDTSEILVRGMASILESWGKSGQQREPLYWVLRLIFAETGLAGGDSLAAVKREIPDDLREHVLALSDAATSYFDDVRYASLEPVTQVWGCVVNGMRVAAESDRATPGQKKVFDYRPDSIVAFFRAARDRMEVADELYHVYKAMPAPECQALAALLNVHVDARLDVDSMRRLVCLLDHEGPMSEEEKQDLAAISNTHLVDAAFAGLRGEA